MPFKVVHSLSTSVASQYLEDEQEHNSSLSANLTLSCSTIEEEEEENENEEEEEEEEEDDNNEAKQEMIVHKQNSHHKLHILLNDTKYETMAMVNVEMLTQKRLIKELMDGKNIRNNNKTPFSSPQILPTNCTEYEHEYEHEYEYGYDYETRIKYCCNIH